MELALTWGVAEANDSVDLPAHIEGLTEADLELFRSYLPDAGFAVRPGSVGKGAAGAGATLIVILERVMNDSASFIEVGAALWLIRSWVQRKRGGAEPTVSEPTTLAALAAASVDQATPGCLLGCQYEKTMPLTVSLEHWAGTDERDVWAVCFSHADGYVALIFVSPSGLVLGSTTVPARFGLQDGLFRERTAAEISGWDGPSSIGRGATP